jgi:hypothetical protein
MKSRSLFTAVFTVLALAFLLLLAPAAFAQPAEPQPTESLVRIQSEVATGDVTAFFEKSVTVAGTTFRQPWESVSWNASTKTVTVGERTMTYAEVMQLVVAIAMQERQAQLSPPPAPPPPPPSPGD